MKKNFLFIFYFFNLSTLLFSSENNSNSSTKQKQLDYFVLRFEVDKQDEEQFKKLFKVPATEFEDFGSENMILFRSYKKNGSLIPLESKKIFTVNQDIIFSINEFDNLRLKLVQRNLILAADTWWQEPGKKYIIKFKDLLHLFEIPHSFDENPENFPKIEIEIQDIQENQLKVRNVLNEVLENVPTDINKLISEYII